MEIVAQKEILESYAIPTWIVRLGNRTGLVRVLNSRNDMLSAYREKSRDQWFTQVHDCFTVCLRIIALDEQGETE